MIARFTRGLTTVALLALLAVHAGPTQAQDTVLASPPGPPPVPTSTPDRLPQMTDPLVLRQLLRLEVQIQQLLEVQVQQLAQMPLACKPVLAPGDKPPQP
jgi:hypothetical protein